MADAAQFILLHFNNMRRPRPHTHHSQAQFILLHFNNMRYPRQHTHYSQAQFILLHFNNMRRPRPHTHHSQAQFILLHFNNMRRPRPHTHQAHTFAASKSKSMAAIYGPVQEAHDLVGICLQLLSCAGRAAHLSIHSRQHRTKGSNVVHRKQEPLARAWLQVGRYSLQYLWVCLEQPQEHRSCGILLLEPE